MTLREKHQQGQFTITVELDPPKSSSAEKTFEQAARLKGKVDAINIADSPMSKMRMSPISLSYLLFFFSKLKLFSTFHKILWKAKNTVHKIFNLISTFPTKFSTYCLKLKFAYFYSQTLNNPFTA